MSFFNQLPNELSAPEPIGVSDDLVQTNLGIYFPQAVRNGSLNGVVSVILPSRLFLYPNGDAGLLQNFVVLDELAKKLGSSIWRYNITAWNEQAENLNVMTNRTYRFYKYKLKLSVSKTAYPGKSVFDIHLTPYSSIVELAAEAI